MSLNPARIAGVCYLLVIAGGLFAEVFVRGSLIVPGDAAETASRIAADESLWRWGLAAHLLYLIPALVVNVLVPGLLAAPGSMPARLASTFGVVSVTVEGVALLGLYVPLALLDERAATPDLDRAPLTYLAVRLFSAGFGFALVFFAAFCVLVGALILRYRRVPRPIGALMVAAGAGYLVNSLALVLADRATLNERLVPWILLPCLVGELSLTAWLLVKGTRAGVPAAATAIREPASSRRT
ncbi:DUF4386 domain-containing protein [Phytohabitans sp. ZYX-F-186]|uniref:DUF4386 domain-containing protein n=1 Tax=Phytohabitans maris TaxID=3071409 RepID=A0ABU0ZD13_9ACTN|nr:DUF4386 domain-containing protein [Phytohabitans sp. ZYX-F-186]MDQ7904945.1 DUF4386 domain-containing protein [Phytohabitans sp. ZYX-F-186]